mmetsp:Transcript_19483/g.26344  ORF Transcript_19483/g.26344 Transcript_19483/m.26344 type:complete len:105 (+) Transcript_19483:48-362(+)
MKLYVDFAPSQCFEKIEASEEYNSLYCVNNSIILAMGILNVILVSYVTYLHFKVGLSSHSLGQLMCKVKTTILLLLLLFELILVVRYGLDFNGSKTYMAILTIH